MGSRLTYSQRGGLTSAVKAALTKAVEHMDGSNRPTPKVTLPRVAFLERPLPAWWNEPAPARTRPVTEKTT